MIGTTRLMADDPGGNGFGMRSFSAFGGERSEREWAAIGKASRDARVRPTTCPQEVSTKRTSEGHVAGLTSRYGYAGTSGYQTHDDFPFLHVGARYYDPATGGVIESRPHVETTWATRPL